MLLCFSTLWLLQEEVGACKSEYTRSGAAGQERHRSATHSVSLHNFRLSKEEVLAR